MELNTSTINLASASTTNWNPWGYPYLVQTLVYPDRIELIYRQDANITYTSYSSQTPPPKITKRIYKTEFVKEIEGRLVPPSPEYFDFQE